jgi:hypothetical protein
MPKHKFQPIFDYIDDKIDHLKGELREEFVTKDEFRTTLHPLQKTMDKILKELVDWRIENKTANYRLTRAEGWIGQAAIKIDLPFET